MPLPVFTAIGVALVVVAVVAAVGRTAAVGSVLACVVVLILAEALCNVPAAVVLEVLVVAVVVRPWSERTRCNSRPSGLPTWLHE